MNSYEIIKELAKSKNIPISELEKIIGVSNGYLVKWKTRKPNPITLEKIADYFGVSTDYLLGRTDDMNFGVTQQNRKLTVEEALRSTMSASGKPLTENDRLVLTRIINAYLDEQEKK
ncbi:helix-turn-helix domain-containing protein [Enterococcus xiangfangensis]|uniref:helix-turn-helix domain-containing protein n=1 Tax=Enterococcus xiangfangensis TaxID=1296537 RepID=UPI003D1720E4|nr:XRE family transcriptional regulator [Enterococcus asini]